MIDLDTLEALARVTNDEDIITAIRRARRGSESALRVCAEHIDWIDNHIAASRAAEVQS